MRAALLACLLAGCVRDDLVTCGESLCPVGRGCDVERGICIDAAGLSIAPAPIGLGDVPCGGSVTQKLEVRSFAERPIQFSAVTTLDAVRVVPASGEFPPGGTVELELVGTASMPSVPGLPLDGKVLLATDAEVVERPVQMTTAGAIIATSVAALDFGEVGTVSVPDTRTFMVNNTGTTGVVVNAVVNGSVAEFSLQSPASVALGPGQQTAVAVKFTPATLGMFTSQVGLTFTGTLCEAPLAAVGVRGDASNDALLVDPTMVDFGEAACGAPPLRKPLKVTNNTPTAQAMTFSIVGPDAGQYTVAGATTISGSASTDLVVERATTDPLQKPGGLDATLMITSPSTTKIIPLKQVIKAPVLSSTQRYYDFGQLSLNTTTTHNFLITNTGNAIAPITATPASFSLPGGGGISITFSTTQIPPNGSATATVKVVVGTVGKYALADGAFSISSPGACSDSVDLAIDMSVP